MKGLELSEKYYKECGLPAISDKFPELLPKVAFGLAGEGSECLGFDDEISRDHDFEPSFCMWLTDEDYNKYSFALSRIYSSLPREFEGIKRSAATPTGGARRGVMRTTDFYIKFLGSKTAPASYHHWLAIPEHALAAATSGKIFRDDLGEFSAIRETLLAGYPEDVRLKKLASALVVSHQSGIYNFERCLAHGERGAAKLAIYTFVKNIAAAVFLINNEFMPFYKWVFRKMSALAVLSELSKKLEALLETNAESTLINEVSSTVLRQLGEEGLISPGVASLEEASYEVNSKIKSPDLRNESIFAGMIRE